MTVVLFDSESDKAFLACAYISLNVSGKIKYIDFDEKSDKISPNFIVGEKISAEIRKLKNKKTQIFDGKIFGNLLKFLPRTIAEEHSFSNILLNYEINKYVQTGVEYVREDIKRFPIENQLEMISCVEYQELETIGRSKKIYESLESKWETFGYTD